MKRAVLSWCAIAALAGAGCYAENVTEPIQAEADARALSGGDNLIECPNSTATSTTALLGPLGGVLSLGGTSITIPAGALLAPAEVTVTTPASQYMEVDISVTGVDHFVFEQPVTVTIDYSRCTRSDIRRSPLRAWYIDSDTKALLEDMGGIDNKLTRTVTFTTPHLSGYALAN